MHNGNILGKKVLQLFIFRMLNIWLSLIGHFWVIDLVGS